MNQHVMPSDLELAALISSKICHDVIGPVGAIYNGLEILDEDADLDAQSYALEVIRKVTQQASARLQFARFAFGAAGSAGAVIDLGTAEQISRGFFDEEKHTLTWQGPAGHMPKDRVKLLLNLIACARTALPRGGVVAVTIAGDMEAPEFRLDCTGTSMRSPQHLAEFIDGTAAPALDPMTIQAYYTWRLAENAHMRLRIEKLDDAVVLSATPLA